MTPFSMHSRLLLLALFSMQSARGDSDFWEMPPICYSDTVAKNSLTQLAADLASGAREVKGASGLDRLKYVLNELHVPEESQVLVFSKTSHQNRLIHPKNPRSLYFSENSYVGYVPGGDIEVIVQDPQLGPVYYLIEANHPEGLKIERDLTTCISCHATSNTENVPGMLIRSVFPDEDGRPLLAMGTQLVDHETPLSERWGGYYVTGQSSLPHFGNQFFSVSITPEPKPSHQTDLASALDVSKYLRSTSDIVALLILEHQCKMHNLLNAAAMNYRRALFLNQILNPDSKPDSGSAGIVAESMAEKIVDCLFFKGEADSGEDLEGNVDFQKTFEARFPRTKDGRSLADFKLYQRVFKYRCSYMVYSEAFKNLPAQVKRTVLKKMHSALSGNDPAYGWLRASENQKVDAILAETLPEWKE
jgi:hypothetical protein